MLKSRAALIRSAESGARRARRGAGAKRPVNTRRIVLEEQKSALLSCKTWRAGLRNSEEEFSQFDEPRYARTASIFGASHAAVPAFKALGSMCGGFLGPMHEQPKPNSAA